MRKLHIICSMCGCNDMFSYSVEKSDEDEADLVAISCNNCSTMFWLDETMKSQDKDKRGES